MAGVVAAATGNSLLGAALIGLGTFAAKARSGTDVQISSDVQDSALVVLAEHAQRLYTQDLIKLTEFARDGDSPFKDTPFATAILNGETYTGEPIPASLFRSGWADQST